MFLSLDPGETTGYARFQQSGQLIDLGQIDGIEGFTHWINELDPKPHLIIYERYRIDPSINHAGQESETIQIIGKIKSYATENGIVAVPQERTILTIGYRWAGKKKLPKSQHHLSHQFDALAHGIYYLVCNKVINLTFDN